MLCHKMSTTFKCKSIKMCLCRRHYRQQNNHQHHQFTNILMLSIIWTMLFTETMARPNLETLLSNKPTNDIMEEEQQQQQQQQQQLQQDLFLDEIMANTNNDKFLNKLKKYHSAQPNFLNKWPGLRDLVLNLDYDDAAGGLEESNEYLNAKFFERLGQLASTKSESYDEDVRDYNNVEANIIPSKSLKSSSSLSANQLTFKDHNIKKNVQYMSPCHFKICNMGRKRNARLLKNY